MDSKDQKKIHTYEGVRPSPSILLTRLKGRQQRILVHNEAALKKKEVKVKRAVCQQLCSPEGCGMKQQCHQWSQPLFCGMPINWVKDINREGISPTVRKGALRLRREQLQLHGKCSNNAERDVGGLTPTRTGQRMLNRENSWCPRAGETGSLHDLKLIWNSMAPNSLF